MELKPPNLWPPIGLSKTEHDATKYLHAVVLSLESYAEGFAAAIALYRFTKSKPANVSPQLLFQWKWFALDAGAMQIWDLREALKLVPRKIGPCASVARHLDRDAMERAVDLFDKTHFPDFKLIRDGIAHRSIVSLSREGYGYTLDDGSLASGRITDDDAYEVINKGKRYSFPVNDETLRKVVEVITAYWAGFAPVEKAFDQAGRSD